LHSALPWLQQHLLQPLLRRAWHSTPERESQVTILTRFRGIATLTALGLISEIGDFARFSNSLTFS